MMTTNQQLDKFFDIAEKEARKQVINYLAYLGEECVSMVREVVQRAAIRQSTICLNVASYG